jgi:peptidyl-prolyl cis-trans isomerase SurA
MEIKNQLILNRLIMKKTYLLVALVLVTAHLFSQTVFTYGDNKVGKEEFLRAYNKNKTVVEDKEKSLREYLDLYIKFKLKVKAAAELRLDTLQQLKYDVQNFSSQVEESYMNDERSVDALLKEAVERSHKDIHVIHFYAPAGKNDSVSAIKGMEEVAANLKKGYTDYNGIATAASGKNITVTAKDIGYITALTLPYSIENMVYSLQPGGVSAVYHAKNGLHVFKNAGERKGAGKWRAAQILFAVPPGATAVQLQETAKKADSIYEILKGGADFTALAKLYSDDRFTAQNGGELAVFGTGKYEPDFENNVFALQHDGDITKPFATTYGYHIVKRIQQQASSAEDEAFVNALKMQIEKDARSNIAKENFIKDITKKTGYKRNAAIKNSELFRYADSVTANNKIEKYAINNKIIFSFYKAAVKGADWLNFVKDYKLNADVYKGEPNDVLLDKYISTAIMDYYRKHLDEYNAVFKYQMKEFKEGNMLFEVMERKVWGKASADSAGLQKFFAAHKEKYLWAASASVILFSCSDTAQANAATAALKNNKDWKEITADSEGKIQSDSGRYELSQLPLAAGITVSEGYISAPLLNSGDNTAGFVKVLQLFPAKQQRTFNEAKGLVINEYQNYLEEKWVAELRKRYPVKVSEVVFKSLLQ